MGAGIAEVAASHGHQVLLYDISAEALTRAIDGIHARLNSRVTRGKLTAETCERTLKRLIPVKRRLNVWKSKKRSLHSWRKFARHKRY